MKIIGLTGGTGSGKSVVSRLLLEKGAYIIDADSIGHSIILKGTAAYNELVAYFGAKILDSDGEILRKKLGAMVFAEGTEKLEFLNKCTHKYIYKEIENEIQEAKKLDKTAIIDAALLLEGDFINLCDKIWVVYADESIRLKRIMQRDNLDEKHGKARIAAQKPWDYYKAHADVIIDNNGNLEYIKKQIDEYFVL